MYILHTFGPFFTSVLYIFGFFFYGYAEKKEKLGRNKFIKRATQWRICIFYTNSTLFFFSVYLVVYRYSL